MRSGYAFGLNGTKFILKVCLIAVTGWICWPTSGDEIYTLFWLHAYPIAINYTTAIVVWKTTQWPAGLFPCRADSTLWMATVRKKSWFCLISQVEWIPNLTLTSTADRTLPNQESPPTQPPLETPAPSTCLNTSAVWAGTKAPFGSWDFSLIFFCKIELPKAEQHLEKLIYHSYIPHHFWTLYPAAPAFSAHMCNLAIHQVLMFSGAIQTLIHQVLATWCSLMIFWFYYKLEDMVRIHPVVCLYRVQTSTVCYTNSMERLSKSISFHLLT